MKLPIRTLPGEDRYDNKAQARAAIREWDRLDRQGIRFEGLRLEAFDESEAREILVELKSLRPDIPATATVFFKGVTV